MDAALASGGFSEDTMLPRIGSRTHEIVLSSDIIGYRAATEPEKPYFALIGMKWLKRVVADGGNASDAFRRIARVVKGLRSPPVHLPRQWSEYHHRNLLAFFALPREVSSIRWVVDLGGPNRCAHFNYLSSNSAEVDLEHFSPADWPSNLSILIERLISAQIASEEAEETDAFAQEIDLQAIGSASVVGGRTYEEWENLLTERQREILLNSIESPIRIVGPAGAGKTLSLCMRALQISRNDDVIAQGKRVLVATHSWAMSERIDGILSTLNGGSQPDGIVVFPLLSLLELHAGHVGNQKIDVIGDDSTDGRRKALDIITATIPKIDIHKLPRLSSWIVEALKAPSDSRVRLDLVINLYEELTGVLTASGVAPDDPESVQEYMNSKREDWMPPFSTVADRGFVISVYKLFIQTLVDRAAITTDQFILDSIRVLETFSWRMRKETDGYDYIFVDELQLFDPQERSSLELLGRSRRGVPFITAEDPSQGVFSALGSQRPSAGNLPVYLDTVHRFNREIFEFISFVYQKFPLNALPLRIDGKKDHGKGRPTLIFSKMEVVISTASELVRELFFSSKQNERICVITLGDGDAEIADRLEGYKLQVTRLGSFDDVEQLSYCKRSIVVSPWQFVGGAQFSHVVVLALGIGEPTSQFSYLREMTSVYLSCSRAAESLSLVCAGYVPKVLREAEELGLIVTSISNDAHKL